MACRLKGWGRKGRMEGNWGERKRNSRLWPDPWGELGGGSTPRPTPLVYPLIYHFWQRRYPFMYLPLKTGTSYTYPPTKVFLSLRASKSEVADVFLVGWSAAIYRLYSEVFLQSVHILGMPFFCVLICMVCGHEGPGVTSDGTVIAWMHMHVIQQYLIESQTHLVQIYTHCFTHCT